MAKVIVACGTGVATSTLVMDKIQRMLKHEKLDVRLVQCTVSEIRGLVRPGDIVVATAQVSSDGSFTVFNAVPFLTGIGEQDLASKLVEALKAISDEG